MIIGLSGKKRSGKDTACLNLQRSLEKLGKKVIRVAFADLLKDEVYQYILSGLKLERKMLDNPLFKEDFRPLLIWWGSTLRRKLTAEEYWINALDRKIINEQLINPNAIIIVTDVRFKNEATFLKTKWNAKIVRINRPLSFFEELKRKIKSLLKIEDLSERDLDNYKFDAVIRNNKGIKELNETITKIVTSFIGDKNE